MAKATNTVKEEATVGLNFKIGRNLSTEIRMMQLNLQNKGVVMDLASIYPELMEIGIESFKKKYKI